MDPRKRKQPTKRNNKATTRDQEKKPTVLEATPSDDSNVGLEEDSNNEQNPRMIKTVKSQLGNSGHQRTSVHDETSTITQSNDKKEDGENVDIPWSELFALQLLRQVNKEDKIHEQDITLLPNPFHKDMLVERTDIKHFGIKTAPPLSSPTDVGASHRPIESIEPRPSTYEFCASSQSRMKSAIPVVQSLDDNEGQPATRPPTHAPLTIPSPKLLGSSTFPSKHAPQIVPRPVQKLPSQSEPVPATLENTRRATPILTRSRYKKMLEQGKEKQK